MWRIVAEASPYAACRLKYSMDSHSSAVRGMGFSADGKYVVTGARDQSVSVWRLTESGQPRLHMTIPVMEAVEALTVLPKGVGYTRMCLRDGMAPLLHMSKADAKHPPSLPPCRRGRQRVLCDGGRRRGHPRVGMLLVHVTS